MMGAGGGRPSLAGTVFTELPARLAAETHQVKCQALQRSEYCTVCLLFVQSYMLQHGTLKQFLLTLIIISMGRLCQGIRVSNFLHSCLHCERPSWLKTAVVRAQILVHIAVL